MSVAIAEPVATQPAAQLILNPVVIFDQDAKTIKATVVISLANQKGLPLRFQAPLIAVPGPLPPEGSSSWTVIWTLVPGSGLQSVVFDPDGGIAIPSSTNPFLPSNVRISGSGMVGGQPAQWQVTVENWVTGANSFNYDLDVIATPIDSGLAAFRVTVHDPTIAVTKDPIT